MLSPYGLDIIENCQSCQMRSERLFCDLSTEALQAFEAIKCATAYPRGAVLFVEGQIPCGIFVLCKGRVKMSACAGGGKVLIVRIAEAGEVLGLSAVLSGKAYELTAETAESCQVNFVQRSNYLRFLREHLDACFKVAEHLSERYRVACGEVRSLGLSRAADERLAKRLLDWCGNSGNNGKTGEAAPCLELALTQEEIGQLIGTSRETVIRTLATFKKQQILQGNGSTLVIRDSFRLRKIAGYRDIN